MEDLKFEESFGRYDGPEDKIDVDLPDGTTARATLVFDQDHEAPWDDGDGRGIVSDWRDKDTKTPGERVLYESDRGTRVRFFDVQGTMQKAKDESWGCGIDAHDHKTKGERAACAVDQEYKYLRAWCRDDWVYVGVVLSIWEDEDTEVDDHAASLWGIECGYEDASAYKSWEYLTSVANDLLSEYLHQHPAALVKAPDEDEPDAILARDSDAEETETE